MNTCIQQLKNYILDLNSQPVNQYPSDEQYGAMKKQIEITDQISSIISDFEVMEMVNGGRE